MLFTHFGVSGPASGREPRRERFSPDPTRFVLRCDLLPDVTEDELDALLANETVGRRQAAGGLALGSLAAAPRGRNAGCACGNAARAAAAEFSKAERRRLVQTVKRLDIPVAGTMGFRKAEVTAGGVALDEVDSRTMQSRLVPNLYFAGELLDLNGPVGGYNFQAAFSTGWLAGESV